MFWTFIVKFDENSTIISPEGMNVLGPFSVGDFGNDNLSISRQVLSDEHFVIIVVKRILQLLFVGEHRMFYLPVTKPANYLVVALFIRLTNRM